jgi:sugar/nucleoside kinase (ribokinase family)
LRRLTWQTSFRSQAVDLPAEPDIRFVAVGDVMVDVLCAESPPDGGRIHADVSVRAGGSAVNAAFSAAEAGAAATVIGRVGSDPSGNFVVAALAERGIDPHLARDPDHTTGAAVALGSSVVAHRGANAHLSPNDIPEVLAAEALLVSGFALFQTGSVQGARAALERFDGRWAAVDLATPKLAQAAKLDDVSRSANVILATADEAHAVTGAEPEEAARILAGRFAVVCIKLGEQGAIAVQESRVERAAPTRVARSSPFGTGDALAGALLVALSRGESLRRALELGCEAGARSAAVF